jgi:hypothetical protein
VPPLRRSVTLANHGLGYANPDRHSLGPMSHRNSEPAGNLRLTGRVIAADGQGVAALACELIRCLRARLRVLVMERSRLRASSVAPTRFAPDPVSCSVARKQSDWRHIARQARRRPPLRHRHRPPRHAHCAPQRGRRHRLADAARSLRRSSPDRRRRDQLPLALPRPVRRRRNRTLLQQVPLLRPEHGAIPQPRSDRATWRAQPARVRT